MQYFNSGCMSVTSAVVSTLYSGFAVRPHSRSMPGESSSTEREANAPKKPGQRTGGWHPMRCSGFALHHQSCSYRTAARRHILELSKSLVLRILQPPSLESTVKSDSLLKSRSKIQINSVDVREGDELVSRTVPQVICNINSIIRSLTSADADMVSSRFAVCPQLDVLCP